MTRTIEGVGINDVDFKVVLTVNDQKICIPSYATWKSLLRRIYTLKTRGPDIKVCDEWLHFSVFHAWFMENYVEGWGLDSRLMNPHDEDIGPTNCIFAPHHLTCFVNDFKNSKYLLGVNFKSGRFQSRVKLLGKKDSIFLGNFDSEEQAHAAWKAGKIKLVHEMKPELDALNSDLFPCILQRYS